MAKLPDQDVIQIAKRVAQANSVSLEAVSIVSGSPSLGEPAIEITLVLTPGSSATIKGKPAASTTSQIVQQLADEGEERFPIVRYEEQGAP